MHTALRFLFFIILLTFACKEPLRLPYVAPELHHWPKPYKGVTGLKLHVFKTGEVRVPKKLVYHSGSFLDTLTLDVLVFAIEHPRQGLILVGTGLSRGVAQGAKNYLGVFRTAIGSPTMAEEQDILSQLENAGFAAAKVKTIILPDLRFSHTGEVENFPAAQVVVSAEEYTAATEEEETALSLSDEYDGVRHWRFIDFIGAEPLGTFQAHRDLFGDGSILVIDVTGATAGGMAVLVRLPHAPVLLCGNLAWTAEQAQYVREPGVVFKREAWWEHAWRLKKFAELAPELVVLPDHEWTTVTASKAKDVVLHPFPPPQKTVAEAANRSNDAPEKRNIKPKQRHKAAGKRRQH
ncbi:MAG TPA: hypothetical protein VNN62_07450 [Methylomirabilota bacterium]|jgi:glyoxylase-like metal-dependent hydrolase (beta-lactamase superfamily II)|nr:hypothetical protein [Methylomirabilota bacterium]